MSVSATELAKLGKCELLINEQQKSGFRRSRRKLKQKHKPHPDDVVSIKRGNAAHDKFEKDFIQYMPRKKGRSKGQLKEQEDRSLTVILVLVAIASCALLFFFF
ncbi:hypothetical protein [Marinomonas algarum]|uniref:Triple QxxK/R motif-containing protein n=1 Tax=Marinomonas algarum TaxID=2883105 RepID=A0A9X1INV7_9GAMM|nr:hypothetical protein [Marinomonas algarum]MCB5162615.1 hypothetical protein [Marinomonas algarum]